MPNNEDWPVIQISQWLKQIIEEQQKGFGLAKLIPSRPTGSTTYSSYFDSVHFQNLRQEPIRTHREDKKDKKEKKLKARAKNAKSKSHQTTHTPQSKYFEDPDHELALFMITDGRSMPQTALCALGCFNLPRAERTHENYLLKAHIHPQFPGWHDYDNWLSTLTDQLADLSQVGFKARDRNGTLRTYKAHLVCITDDMVDRNRMMSDEYPEFMKMSGCLVCSASGEVDPSLMRPPQRDATGWDRNNLPAKLDAASEKLWKSAYDSCAPVPRTQSDDEGRDQTDQPTELSKNDKKSEKFTELSPLERLKHCCNCQAGYFPLIPPDEGLPEPVARWRPYVRDIFGKLGSLDLTTSHPPDLSHVYNHLIPDLLYATQYKCSQIFSNDHNLMEQSRGLRRLRKLCSIWESRKTPGSLMYVRRLEVMDMFTSVYYLLSQEKQLAPLMHFLTCVQRLMFYISQLCSPEFTGDGLVRLQNCISRAKWELYNSIAETDPELTRLLSGYSMHLLDHLVRWTLMIGPLCDVWGQHTLRLVQRTTYLVLSRSSGDFKEKLLDEVQHMQRERAASSGTFMARGKYLIKTFSHKKTPAFMLPRIEVFAAHVIKFIEDTTPERFVDIHWYHAQTLVHNFLGQASIYPITSNFTDGLMHMVEITPYNDPDSAAHNTTEYALLFGFFDAESEINDEARSTTRAIICPQIDPKTMVGFSDFTITKENGDKIRMGEFVSLSQAFTRTYKFVSSETIVREIYMYTTEDPDKYMLHCPTRRAFSGENCELIPLVSQYNPHGDVPIDADLPPWTWSP